MTAVEGAVGAFYEICAEYKGHLIRRYFWDEQRTRPRLLYSSFVGFDLLTDTTLKGIKMQIDNVTKVI